ncbi:response regulator transcription factor [Bradyrhizobium genosp. P]|uniref:response regulator transcription factor n=1 Tax=Bradyrhizobium genosp. P TaxID=83641 RepID=UPI003CF75F68
MRVLIVEDEPDLASFLASILVSAGLVVDRSGSIGEALQALETAPFDIAIVDRRLPDGDGLSIVEAMKERELVPAFLILTARDAKSDVIEGLNSGSDSYVERPGLQDLSLVEQGMTVRSYVRPVNAAPGRWPR